MGTKLNIKPFFFRRYEEKIGYPIRRLIIDQFDNIIFEECLLFIIYFLAKMVTRLNRCATGLTGFVDVYFLKL